MNNSDAQDVIRNALKNCHQLKIKAKSDPQDSAYRIINPYALYGSQVNSTTLDCVQIDGYSKKAQLDLRKKLPDWRNFPIQNIAEAENTNIKFVPNDPGFNPSSPKYKKNISFLVSAEHE